MIGAPASFTLHAERLSIGGLRALETGPPKNCDCGSAICLLPNTEQPCRLYEGNQALACDRAGPPYGRPRLSLRQLANRYTPGLVSIVIPCLNAAPYLERAISSALRQTYQPVEVIVIDDGSTDGSAEIAASFAKEVTTCRSSGSGACSARNDGLETAQGEFIQFLDADDMLVRDAVARRIDCITDGIAAVFGDRLLMDSDDSVIQSMTKAHAAKGWGKKHPGVYILSPGIHTAEPLHRRSTACGIGGFDELLPQQQEADFHLRLYLAGLTMRYTPGPVVMFRHYRSERRISQSNWWDCDEDRFIKIACQRVYLSTTRANASDASVLRESVASMLCSVAVQLTKAGRDGLARRYVTAAVQTVPGFRPRWLPSWTPRQFDLETCVRLRALLGKAIR